MYSDILFPDNNQKGGKSMSRDNKEVMSKSSGFATAGLVLGIIGVCTSFIPIINNCLIHFFYIRKGTITQSYYIGVSQM